MGRAFEARKHAKFKRWSTISKTFARLSKEITSAVKANGPLPENNAQLRVIIQNAKNAQMPKEKIEAAISRAIDKNTVNYEEITYEAYGPHMIAFVVEASTDNVNRTASSLRSCFTKAGGTLCPSGTHSYIFSKKAIFAIETRDADADSLALTLIDSGAEDIKYEGDITIIQSSFENFGSIQKTIEGEKLNLVSAEVKLIPTVFKTLRTEKAKDVYELVDKLNDDDDVNFVYTNLKVQN